MSEQRSSLRLLGLFLLSGPERPRPFEHRPAIVRSTYSLTARASRWVEVLNEVDVTAGEDARRDVVELFVVGGKLRKGLLDCMNAR